MAEIKVLDIVAAPGPLTRKQIAYRIFLSPIKFDLVIHAGSPAALITDIYAKSPQFSSLLEDRCKLRRLELCFDLIRFEFYRSAEECMWQIQNSIFPKHDFRVWQWYDELIQIKPSPIVSLPQAP